MYNALKSFAETVREGGRVSLRDLRRLIPKEEPQQVLEKYGHKGSGGGLICASVLQRPRELREEQLKGARRSTMPRGPRGRAPFGSLHSTSAESPMKGPGGSSASGKPADFGGASAAAAGLQRQEVAKEKIEME